MASFLPPTSKLSIDSIWFCYFISPLPSCSLLSRYSLWFSTNQKSSKLFDRIIQHSRILQHRSGLFSTSYGRRDLISSPLYHVRSDRYLSPPPRFFSGEEGKEGGGRKTLRDSLRLDPSSATTGRRGIYSRLRSSFDDSVRYAENTTKSPQRCSLGRRPRVRQRSLSLLISIRFA